MDKNQQKEIAIQCMEKLDLYKPYITKFKSKAQMPCFYENFGGFWADQEPELWSKIKEIEEEKGCIIYAITHEFNDYGETWSMLCVPQDNDEEYDLVFDAGRAGTFYAFAYVWNKTTPMFSEMGDIVVRSFGGGIKRIG